MAGFSVRSVAGSFWLALLLCPNDAMLRLVRGVVVDFSSVPAYQTCIANPATCTVLDLGDTSSGGAISCTLPTEIGLLTNLQSLDVRFRYMVGTLPTELGELKELTNFDAYGDSFTGTIPTQMGRMTKLQTLDLKWNQLTGGIPMELGQMTKLTKLYLESNAANVAGELGGAIPTELGLLTMLEEINLSSNSFTGPIPTELVSSLGLLTIFNVASNADLCGDPIVSVGSVGTTYSGAGISGTNLGNACVGAPTVSPTVSPTGSPTAPTVSPTASPTASPTKSPTKSPTGEPTMSPTGSPTAPTVSPTGSPTGSPTVSPTVSPTGAPTISCSTVAPNPDPSVDTDGRNGIMRAAMSGDQTNMTTALADAAQFIDLMDNSKFGYNALMLAAQYDHQDVARMLLDAGAITCPLTETDSSEENNWSNVMVAAWYGDEEITRMFLTASTEHLDTVCDYYHMTPLHAAVSRGHSRTTSVLTSFGANVNALDSDNMTPLHYAVKSGHFKCAKTLLAAGAHKHLEDDEDKTACDYAAEGVRAFGEVKGNISHDIQALLGSCAVPP